MSLRILALAVLFAGLSAASALGHDIYSPWRMPDHPGTSCCHGQDCRPTRAYMGEDGLWRAWDGQQWLTVPPGKVLPTDLARDGRNHLCSRNGVPYCFSPTLPKG